MKIHLLVDISPSMSPPIDAIDVAQFTSDVHSFVSIERARQPLGETMLLPVVKKLDISPGDLVVVISDGYIFDIEDAISYVESHNARFVLVKV